MGQWKLRMTEHDIYEKIKRVSILPRFQITWDRVESPLTSPGIPDLIGTRRGQVVFVELKSGKSFKWREDQRAWAARHVSAGAIVYLLAHVGGCYLLWHITKLAQCRMTTPELLQEPYMASGIIDDVLGEIFNA
jgi:hypothetical protein